ncbi:MAG: PAS domain S-box protein, partial [Pirellulaceae bacterium]|nr:PAS domain S-box protein [Pirellulaceae bacterium]
MSNDTQKCLLESASDCADQLTEKLFAEQRKRLHRQTHHVFVLLMSLQWVVGVGMALFISPNTWIGDQSQVHVHVWAAVILGGLLSSLPVCLALRAPDSPMTHHVMAVSQMLWSALLIHLCGGRIETHFHVFGSLAFLAFYRDWRVLVTASVVITADHMMRGLFWPQSAFGVVADNSYRWLEHAGWVVFEDVFLIVSCVRGTNEMREICRRQSQVELTNRRVELAVKERTAELNLVSERLSDANEMLKREVIEHGRAEHRFRLVFDSSPNGIIKVGDDGRIDLVNQAVELLFGYDRNDLMGKDIDALILQTEPIEFHTATKSIGKRRDGTEFPVEVTMTPIKYMDRPYVLMAVADLSARHAAEIQLRHAQNLESVGRLASGVAHEINTPMQFIGDNLKYLEKAFGRVRTMLDQYRELPTDDQSFQGLLEPIEKTTKSKRFNKLLNEIPLSFQDASEGVSRVSEIVQAMK